LFVLILSFSFLMSFGAGVETPAPFLQKDLSDSERSFNEVDGESQTTSNNQLNTVFYLNRCGQRCGI